MKNKQGNKQQIHNLKLNPLSKAIHQHRALVRASILAASATLATGTAIAQDTAGDELMLEEVMVTAQKREQSLQDVPVSVMALGTRDIHELGIRSFSDYVLQFPNVSFKSFGTPGSATLYMRGIADGGDGNSSGASPSVGLYLDEQPVTAITRNLDIHIYDIERIEALGGPQGTLFGASSQSGMVRIITNKPNTDLFEAGFDLNGYGTKGGDASYSVEGYANIPMGERVALRLVAWYVNEGGWIDNVAGTRTYQLEGGYGYNELYYPPAPYGRTNTINNDHLIENDINELEKTGLRAALRVNLSDNWTGTLGVITQKTDADGLWEYDETLDGDSSVMRFWPDWQDDKFTQGSLTIEGNFDKAQLVYAGAWLDRDVDYHTDYSQYGEDSYFVPYYVCDYSATGPDLATQSNTDCTSLDEYYLQENDYKRTSHELRLVSMGDGRFHYTVGLYYEDAKHAYFQQWYQPGMSSALQVTESPSFNGVLRPDLFFRTDQERKDKQKAIFGELTFDFTERLSGTIGARWFDEKHKSKGVVGYGPGNFSKDDPHGRDVAVDSKVSFDDSVFKANLSWRIDDDKMIYATWSEGYRPGGINRDPAFPIKVWTPDFMTNYEFGWKTTWNNGRVRWNGAAYIMDWDNIQYTYYQFSLSACCGIVYNLSTAKVKGFETDISILASENFTLSAAVAYNNAKTTDDFQLPPPFDVLTVPDGTRLPNVPKWKGNIVGRYHFDIADMPAYAQLTWSYTGKTESEIVPGNSFPQDSYSIVNFRTGFNKQTWGVDLYVNNLTDEVAQLYRHPRRFEPTTVTNRPRSYGLQYWMRF